MRFTRAPASLAAAATIAALSTWGAGCGGMIAPEPTPEPTPRTPAPPPTSTSTPVGPTTPAPEPEPVPTTGAIPKNTCLTLLATLGGPLRFGSIDLATGAVTKGILLKLSTDFTYDPSSIAVLGSEVLFCDGARIIRASRVDGSVRFIDNHRCEAIAATSSGVLLVIDDVAKPVLQYPDVESLRTNQNATALPQLRASRLGVAVDGPIAAWHSAGEVLRMYGSAVKLDSYDDWIFGLSGAPGGRILVSSPRADGDREGVIAFDAATGKRLGVIAYAPETSWGGGLGFKGLACAL